MDIQESGPFLLVMYVIVRTNMLHLGGMSLKKSTRFSGPIWFREYLSVEAYQLLEVRIKLLTISRSPLTDG